MASDPTVIDQVQQIMEIPEYVSLDRYGNIAAVFDRHSENPVVARVRNKETTFSAELSRALEQQDASLIGDLERCIGFFGLPGQLRETLAFLKSKSADAIDYPTDIACSTYDTFARKARTLDEAFTQCSDQLSRPK